MPFGTSCSLDAAEDDRVAPLDVEVQFPVEHQEELVLVVVLMPMVLAVEHAQPDQRIVHRGQRLIEPRNRYGIRFRIDVDRRQRSELVVH